MRQALARSASVRPVSDLRFLIHIATGADNPTRSALGLLVAKSACEEGHEVKLFLAGDAAPLVLAEVAGSVQGLGTGNAGEWLDYLRGQNVQIFVSGMSAKARGIEPDWLTEHGFLPSPPTKLVALAADADRVLVY